MPITIAMIAAAELANAEKTCEKIIKRVNGWGPTDYAKFYLRPLIEAGFRTCRVDMTYNAVSVKLIAF